VSPPGPLGATDAARTAFRCAADNYNNGGQDWTSAYYPAYGAAICRAGTAQSPINVADTVVTYGSLPALNVAYGAASSWILENTGAR
jgi:carbonic anhydrase